MRNLILILAAFALTADAGQTDRELNGKAIKNGSGKVNINATGTVTLPAVTDTLVGKATTDTLTNKTIDADGTGNSISNIENADIKTGAGIARDKLATAHAVTEQKFTSTGTTAGYVFIVTSANATAGATYTNNSNTYTVLSTISSGTILFTSQANVPEASGTLTKAAGTGDSTITFSVAYPLAVYTTPSNPAPTYINVRMWGGGGGGSGSGSGTPAGSDGVISTFAYAVAAGGPGGNSGSSRLTSALSSSMTGNIFYGTFAPDMSGSGFAIGGRGGQAPWQNGAGGQSGSTGVAALANTGSGGGGGGVITGGGGTNAGSGGQSADMIEAVISNPGASYYYSVGTGGAAGSAGLSGTGRSAGGAGAAGLVWIREIYL